MDIKMTVLCHVISRPIEYRVSIRAECKKLMRNLVHGIGSIGSIQRVTDLSSEKINLVVISGHHGGMCGPRHKLDQSLPMDRFDSGFCLWIPANLTVWGYSESVS
jgi:hypothetical protein